MLFPVLLMLFALAMERVEVRLRRLSVREEDIDEFLESANNAEVTALEKTGLPDALTRFHRRRSAPRSGSEAPRRRAG